MDHQEILNLIQEKKYIQLKNILSEMNEVDIAEILDPLDQHTTLLIFRMLPKDLAADVFAYFSPEQQSGIINSISDRELKDIMDELFFDDMIDIIEEMPANVTNKILKNSSVEERRLINQFLMYPPDSAGSLMTIEYVELKKNMTVRDALAHLKEIGFNKETIYTCYVTNNKKVLEGYISLRTLVTSPEDEIIENLMEDEVIYVNTHDDQETVANVFIKYGFMALPVVDKESRLVGIITFDDIMDVMEQEATEDFQRMAAMAPSEETYLSTGVFTLAKNRIVWLLILMISATFTGMIMAKFQDVLQSVVILATFVPMLMDTGGNSGNQSSTLIIRGLATGEITLQDGWKVLWKEFRVSLTVSIILSVVNFVRVLLFTEAGFMVAVTVTITLFVTVVVSKLIGGTLPLLAKRLNIDPAIMAGPLITTIVDAISLSVYFYIASLILNISI